MMAFFLSACSSTTITSSPEFLSWGVYDKTKFVKISLTNSSAFAPSSVSTILMECRRLPKDSENDIASLKDSECRLAQSIKHDVNVGIFPSFGSAVVNSAAMVGGAYFIGKGLDGNGDNNTTTYNDSDFTTATDGSNTYNSSGGGHSTENYYGIVP